MVVDCHYHHTPDVVPVEDLLNVMDKAGIDKTVLIPPICGAVPETPEFLKTFMRYTLNRPLIRPIARKLITRFNDNGDVIIPSGVIDIIQEPDNAMVFETVDRHPDRFLAWCMVNPNGPQNPVEEYKKWMDHPACIGVKAHAHWHRFDPDSLLSVSELLVRRKRPLIIHLGFDSQGDIITLSNELPELKIILAHAAFPCYYDTWRQIKNRKNVMVDLSCPAYVDKAIMKHVSDYLGVSRCLYGTDGPFMPHGVPSFDPGYVRQYIETVHTDKGIRNRILSENFLEFIGN